jgi:hypothetical protein
MPVSAGSAGIRAEHEVDGATQTADASADAGRGDTWVESEKKGATMKGATNMSNRKENGKENGKENANNENVWPRSGH